MTTVTGKLILISAAAGLMTATGWHWGHVAAGVQSAAGAPAAQVPGSLCVIGGDKIAVPASALLGTTRDVTLTLQPQCARRQGVVVLASIGTDFGGFFAEFMPATQSWFRSIDLTHLELAFVGKAGSGPKVLAPMTDDNLKLLGGLSRATRDYAVLVPEALHVATDELFRVRSADGTLPSDQFMLVLGDQINAGQAGAALEEAERAKSAGVEVFVVGYAVAEVTHLASSPRHFFSCIPNEFDGYASFHSAYGRARRAVEQSVSAHFLAAATVTDTLPANMRYVSGSARHAAGQHALRQRLRPPRRQLGPCFAHAQLTVPGVADHAPHHDLSRRAAGVRPLAHQRAGPR